MNTTSTVTSNVRRALIVVDVQNDFVEGGSLAVTGGRAVAAAISEHLSAHAEDYALVVASRDFHNAEGDNGGHFAAPGEQPDFATTWPIHCVAGTEGAAYADELDTARIETHIVKGMGIPAYSAFQGVTDDGATLAQELQRHDISAIDVVGIATDYCVRATALDAATHVSQVRLLVDLAVAVNPANVEAVVAELADAGVTTIRTQDSTENRTEKK